MKTTMLLCLSLIGCSGTEPLPVTAAGSSTDPRFLSVISYLDDELQRHHIPGAAIAIVENGALVASAGVGEKQQGVDGAVAPTTLFRVASLSKMVAAATAMKLVEEGTIDLSQPVTRYVPLGVAAGFDPSSITLQHLLTHASGLPDLSIGFSCPVGPGQAAAWFAAHATEPLWTPPGQVYDYSNRGFAVLGWALSQASGQAYADAVAQRVLGPAGMTTATFDPALAMTEDHAVGHFLDSGTLRFQAPDAYDCEATRPADGVIASVVDYAHLAETLLASGGSMLSPASVTAMETGHIDTHHALDGASQYGLGLDVFTGYKGLTVISHDGHSPGFETTMVLVPAQNFAAIVFFNADFHTPDSVAKKAIDEYLDVADVAPPVETTDVASWGPYAGTYVDALGGLSVTVTLAGNTLATTGSVETTLMQASGDEFELSVDGSTIDGTFYPGENGPAQWFVTRQGVAERQ